MGDNWDDEQDEQTSQAPENDAKRSGFSFNPKASSFSFNPGAASFGAAPPPSVPPPSPPAQVAASTSVVTSIPTGIHLWACNKNCTEDSIEWCLSRISDRVCC